MYIHACTHTSIECLDRQINTLNVAHGHNNAYIFILCSSIQGQIEEKRSKELN